MRKQQVKLNNWLFDEGEQAQLIWISSPFLQDKKTMIHAYFRVNDRTEKLVVDWGTLPALAIQHYYMNGDISQSIPPSGIEEVEITIYPNAVRDKLGSFCIPPISSFLYCSSNALFSIFA